MAVTAIPLARCPGHENLERMAKPIMDFSQLTVAERIQLAEDLWDSISEARVETGCIGTTSTWTSH